MQPSKDRRYSITPSARARMESGSAAPQADWNSFYLSVQDANRRFWSTSMTLVDRAMILAVAFYLLAVVANELFDLWRRS
jgi:hypothetical protein